MYIHTMIYFCTELWTEQHTLSEDGKENTCSNGQHLPPRFKLELKLESELLSPIPVRGLEPQEEQHTVAHREREATSKWLRWILGRRGIRDKALPPLQQHLAQCLLSEQVKRRERRRQSRVAHLPERGARIG